MNKIIVLGIGYKARQGKDYLSTYMKSKLDNCHIIHWADVLKEEVMNTERKFPLIYKTGLEDGSIYYNLFNKTSTEFTYYHVINSGEVPMLHNIFTDRKIDMYWGMDGNGSDELKDAPMLQFWGTDYRRKFFDPDYWVKLTTQKIQSLVEAYGNPDVTTYILIPDTRFKNEVFAVKNIEMITIVDLAAVSLTGYYIKVSRTNEDGTPYYDPSRDKNHPSECDLDDVIPDGEVTAKSGDLQTLYDYADKLIEGYSV